MTDRIQPHKTLTKLEQLCMLLNLDPQRILRRAGLPVDYLKNNPRAPTPEQYFAVWSAVVAESARDDLALFVGRAYAQGPFNPAVYAFSNSPDVVTGLHRLALFKALDGPCKMSIVQSRGGTEITITSELADASIPPDMQALELIYLLENIRHCTQRHVIPKAIHIPHPDQISPREAAYFGIMPEPGNRLRITLNAQDAALPLVMKDPDQWTGLTGAPQTTATTLNTDCPTALRVRSALVELLPAGFSTVSEVASHLHVSARTLQRQLTSEGVRFQTVLDETRCELALNYLQRGDISIDEISYLLAYSAPNSFYRAFQNWTGMTPQQARSAAA